MAAGGTKKGLSASVLAGSDQIYDFYCQPCSTDNIHLEAFGFCSDCKEYLCKTCFHCHRRSTASKDHSLLDKSSMPKTKPKPKVKDVLKEKCPTHTDKVIEYFCNDHIQLCCSVCLNMSHITCSKSYIPELSDGLASSQGYQQLKAELDKLASVVNGNPKEIQISRQTNKTYRLKALANISEFRKEMNKLLIKLEKDTVKEISRLYDENEEKLNKMSAKFQSLSSDLKDLAVNLEKKVKARNERNLYVQMKQMKVRLSDMETDLKATRKYRISPYKFNQDEKLQEMIYTLSSIWSLSVRQDAANTKARYIRDVNVKSADDATDCMINGIAVLTGDRIVVTDFGNMAVKLTSVNNDEVMCSVPLSSKPLGLTLVKDDQIAVSLGNEQKIEIFSVSKTLSRTNTIKAPGANLVGLQYDGQGFLISCQQPGSIKIIDMSGKVLRTFITDSNGKPLFTKPGYIALSRDHDVLYVADFEDDTVTCMTVGGKVISVYKHDKLKYPQGVAVDTDGSVYVCSRNTHAIHQLTPTGILIQMLLGVENGLSVGPQAIAYGDKDDKLYICSLTNRAEFNNNVKVFQLE